MLELTLEEAQTILRKLEYTYKKKGSPLIDKIRAFVETELKKQNP